MRALQEHKRQQQPGPAHGRKHPEVGEVPVPAESKAVKDLVARHRVRVGGGLPDLGGQPEHRAVRTGVLWRAVSKRMSRYSKNTKKQADGAMSRYTGGRGEETGGDTKWRDTMPKPCYKDGSGWPMGGTPREQFVGPCDEQNASTNKDTTWTGMGSVK